MNKLNAFDEYPVEHFHSILRAQCKESDSGDMLRQKAKAIGSMKESSSNFRSTFAVPKHNTATRGRLAKLKFSAAEFLCNVLQEIKDTPTNASVVTRPKGAKKSIKYCKLRQIYGDQTVSSKKFATWISILWNETKPNEVSIQIVHLL